MMINVVDKTSFSPNLNNKTTSVAGIYQSIIQPQSAETSTTIICLKL
jgi:hypothetical protein